MIINLSPVRKPLILVGEGWQKVITDLFTEQGSYIRESDRSHVRFVAKITDAANLINGNLK